MDKVLGMLKLAGILPKNNKWAFGQNKVEYLVQVTKSAKLAAAVDRTLQLSTSTFPPDKTRPKTFMGACNIYRPFIKSLYQRAGLLNDIEGRDWIQTVNLRPTNRLFRSRI